MVLSVRVCSSMASYCAHVWLAEDSFVSEVTHLGLAAWVIKNVCTRSLSPTLLYVGCVVRVV